MARANTGITRLLSAMKKMIEEVNDQEICRRLEILMNTEKEDLPPAMIKSLLQNPAQFDPSEVSEPYTQYVKHYLFMVKREGREKERQRMERERTAREKAARQARARSNQNAGTRLSRETSSGGSAAGLASATVEASASASAASRGRKKTARKVPRL